MEVLVKQRPKSIGSSIRGARSRARAVTFPPWKAQRPQNSAKNNLDAREDPTRTGALSLQRPSLSRHPEGATLNSGPMGPRPLTSLCACLRAKSTSSRYSFLERVRDQTTLAWGSGARSGEMEQDNEALD